MRRSCVYVEASSDNESRKKKREREEGIEEVVRALKSLYNTSNELEGDNTSSVAIAIVNGNINIAHLDTMVYASRLQVLCSEAP